MFIVCFLVCLLVFIVCLCLINVYPFLLLLASEDTDWSKLSSQGSDWPSAIPNTPASLAPGSNKKEMGGASHMTGSDVMFMANQDTLESVLRKLSLSEHLSLFQVIIYS